VTHVLRIRDFGLFLSARFCNVLAAQMQWVAVGWYLYDLTRDPMTLGWAGLAAFVPIALLTLPAGDLADRADRRLVLFAAHLIQALAAALLLVLVAVKTSATWPFYGALVLSGTTRALAGPASKSLAPLLVPREQFAQSVAWGTSAQQIAIITGPALGGLIYLAGAPVTFGACLVVALGAALAMLAIRTRVVASKEAGGTAFSRALAGLRYLMTQPIVLGAISLDLFAVLLGGVTALLPIYARDILEAGPLGLGILRAAPAVGALLMTIVLARHSINRHVGLRMFQAVIVFGAATVVFALSQWMWLSVLALAMLGAADTISVVIRFSLVQLSTPDEMRGRVGAVNFLFINASNQLGQFESGVTAALLGTVPAAVLGGVGTIAIALLWMKLFPALRKVERLE